MKKRNIIIISIITVILLVIIITTLVTKGIPMSSNSKTIKELYSYVGSTDLGLCGGLVTYSESEVKNEDLSEEVKFCLAYTSISEDATTQVLTKEKKNDICKLGKDKIFATDNYEDDICTLDKISKDKINEKYQSMFGKSINEYIDFSLDGANICYYNEGNYYCGLKKEYTYTYGAEPHTYRVIKNSYKKDDTIVIYDYFLKVIDNECYSSFMERNEMKECSKNILGVDKINYKFLRKNGITYKHTFKKNTNGYYWVSSKKIA